MTDLLERIENMPPKRLALLVLEMQSRLEKLERPDPSIAIIGLGITRPISKFTVAANNTSTVLGKLKSAACICTWMVGFCA